MKMVTILLISRATLNESKLVEDSSIKEGIPKGCGDSLSVECKDPILRVLCEGTDVFFNEKDVTIPCCIEYVLKFSEDCKKSSVIYDDNVNCKNNQSAVGKVAFVLDYCNSLLED